MADYTFEVMVIPAAHDLSGNPEKAARRYIVGDIIDVFPSERYAIKQGNSYRMQSQLGRPRTGFIHVTGVPDQYTIRQLKGLLEESAYDSISLNRNMVRKRVFRFDPTKRANDWNALLTNKEVTISLSQARQFICKKVINDLGNPDLDGLTEIGLTGEF